MAPKKAKKTTKAAKRPLTPPLPEAEPEFEELTKEDTAVAAVAAKVDNTPEVKEAVAQAVKVAEKKAKQGPLTIEDVKEIVVAATKSTVEQMMPAVASAIIQANVPRVAGAVAVVPGQRQGLRRCYLCSQDERVCGGKEENHVKMVVGPRRYPEFGKWFRGAGINGIWYRSDGPNHKIVVPKAALGSIMAIIDAFELDERQTGGRRFGEHDHGQLAEAGTGEKTRIRQPKETHGWR